MQKLIIEARVSGLPLLAGAIGSDGHVAVGLEDSPWEEFGCPSNAELVTRVVDIARSMGREIATPAEAREILGFDD
jgi:3-keto-5-aminohexanoate cleavage enzyme